MAGILTGSLVIQIDSRSRNQIMDHSNYAIDEMISAKSIAARVEALAKEITANYNDADKLVVVGLLRGSFVFIADLVRELKMPVEVSNSS